MMKKQLQPILTLVIAVLLLAACGRSLTDPTGTSENDTTAASQARPSDSKWDWATKPEQTYPDQYTTEMKISVQYLPAVVDNPDNLPVLKWLCLIQSADFVSYGRVWSEAAAMEVNQMLADRNMPFRVQFAIYVSDYIYENVDWLARPEIQEDLETADLILHDFPLDQVEDYLTPLTAYITGTAEPTLKNAVPHEKNWSLTTKDEEIYGISYCHDYPVSAGWRVDPKLLSDFGLTVQDFQKEFWEMDEVLAKIYEKNGNKSFFYIQSEGVFGSTRVFSGRAVKSLYPNAVGLWMQRYFTDSGYVFTVDFSQEKPTVINMLDTEISRKIQAALKRYSEAGYLIRIVGDGESLLELLQFNAGRPHYDSRGKLAIPVTEPTYDGTRESLSRSNSVMAASEHKEEAIALLNLIAEDEAFRSHLLFGKEGRDYTVDADGHYERVKQEDGSSYNMKFLSPLGEFSDFVGDEGSGARDYDVVYEGMTELETYLEICDNGGDTRYWVPFDYTGLEKEVEEVRIWARYYFINFTKLSEEDYNKMIADINAAGGTKIMAELQKQLDQWVKENPDKVAANRS